MVAWNGQDSSGSRAAGGTILVENSTSTHDGEWGFAAMWYDANGAALTFQDCTVNDSVTRGSTTDDPDAAAIGVKRGGGAVHPMGNVTFTRMRIGGTHLQRDFSVEDYSQVGLSALHIGSFAAVSSGSTGRGLVNGANASSLEVP